MSLVSVLHGAKRWSRSALGVGLSVVLAGCSSLGGFDYGDGEADRFTAGDDEPYVPKGDDDDDDDSTVTGPITGPTGTGVDPTSTDDGADLRPLDSDSGSSDATGGSGESGSTDDTGGSSDAGDTMDPGDFDTSGTSGPSEPSEPTETTHDGTTS